MNKTIHMVYCLILVLPFSFRPIVDLKDAIRAADNEVEQEWRLSTDLFPELKFGEVDPFSDSIGN